jgi:hypothetical protein
LSSTRPALSPPNQHRDMPLPAGVLPEGPLEVVRREVLQEVLQRAPREARRPAGMPREALTGRARARYPGAVVCGERSSGIVICMLQLPMLVNGRDSAIGIWILREAPCQAAPRQVLWMCENHPTETDGAGYALRALFLHSPTECRWSR